MVARPQCTSRQSTATTSDGSCSMFSADRTTILTQSTAPTSPDLGSPVSVKKAWLPSAPHGAMQGTMAAVQEVSESPERPRLSSASKSRRGSAELERGKSVKDRVGMWEHGSNAVAGPSTLQSLQPRGPTTPLRLPNKSNSTPSPLPTKGRRVPVPLTEPTRKSSYRLASPPRTGPSELRRGTGSAKKMIQQWEAQPDGSPTRRTPSSNVLQPTKRVYSTDYLNGKPLPVPSATPLPSSSLYPASSPSKPLHSPQYLATPTRHSTNLTTPTASPSSPRKGKGKSPLKDMLDRFGGGIKDVGRKMKGKGKDRSPGFGFGASPLPSRDDLHFWEEPKYGSNGLPGGIVFSDRMGDQEMNAAPANVRTCLTHIW